MIDERPAIAEAKKRISDWEIDTLMGKSYKGALLSIVERKSKFTLMGKFSSRRADLVAEATIDLLNPHLKKAFTITADNGKEFAHHERIKDQLKTDVYFAHSYHA